MKFGKPISSISGLGLRIKTLFGLLGLGNVQDCPQPPKHTGRVQVHEPVGSIASSTSHDAKHAVLKLNSPGLITTVKAHVFEDHFI
ncbi:hypothetical protein CPAR01_05580 [Colletotrichum paranaense]|uniref:Uncharacterized protein n=1 Tax=Colletotrichum paranaense TaxID=1914294 RepID=A0ABQ9SRN1_9PEZI|nr:uncharacterized protein CPAR01_05580 [Colletotrichum paranaense]KAK1542193.1 hypothetical protein CPAR01_05580 [Colletotrichum paranaense]